MIVIMQGWRTDKWKGKKINAKCKAWKEATCSKNILREDRTTDFLEHEGVAESAFCRKICLETLTRYGIKALLSFRPRYKELKPLNYNISITNSEVQILFVDLYVKK